MTTHTELLSPERIREALHAVKDPEIPTVSLEELGMLHKVEVNGSHVTVEAIPTFAGCPALDIMKEEMEKVIRALDGVETVDIQFVYDVTWTSDRISATAREKMKAYGVAPPPVRHRQGDPWEVDCPFCGSTYTTMENIFGPAACKSMLYCRSCKNPFEAMKPV